MSAPIPETQRTRVAVAKPLWTRVSSFVGIWTMKASVSAYLATLKLPAELQPTYTKSYPSRPKLVAHVFIPKTFDASATPAARYPLLIDVHGGGFAIGSPKFDYRNCAAFAHERGFVVVSLAYNLAPLSPFPGPVHDIAAQMADVLADDSLPVDRSRVAAIGWSAGGNLVATALQLNGLHDRVQALVPVYPATDFAVEGETRWAARIPNPNGTPDMLKTSSGWFTWAYVSAGTHLADPLLSPRYADRAKLPRSVFILGCEYDMLCSDARNMALDVAAQEAKAEGVEKKVLDEGEDEGWETGRVRWRQIKGVEHGFDAVAAQRKGEVKELYERKAKELVTDVAEWLERVAFK